MFHTPYAAAALLLKKIFVVIPWRGFRCFTQRLRERDIRGSGAVVIPWRGFRCFTPYEDVFVFEFEVEDEL